MVVKQSIDIKIVVCYNINTVKELTSPSKVEKGKKYENDE